MEDEDLIEAFVSMANSIGEDLNDGDEHPGWMTAEWADDDLLEITYENTDNEKTTQKYRITRVED